MDIHIITIGIMLIIYFTYQSIRYEVLMDIFDKWEEELDYRYYKYNIENLLSPTKENWFGFKYPKEEDYTL